jgi:hypothetical protein
VKVKSENYCEVADVKESAVCYFALCVTFLEKIIVHFDNWLMLKHSSGRGNIFPILHPDLVPNSPMRCRHGDLYVVLHSFRVKCFW